MGQKYYAHRRITISKGKSKLISMHRVIMNAPDDMEVDHINGNSLDNQKENLRLCTHQENNFNKQAQKNSKSGIKGVFPHKATGKFEASIRINSKSIYLGLFDTLEEAKQVYRKAEIKYFGKFARKKIE